EKLMKLRLTVVGTVTIMFLLANLLIGSAYSNAATGQKKNQQGKVKKEHAQKSKGAAGADPNIRSETTTNDPNKHAPAQPNKGGEKSKGPGPGVGTLHVDNESPWYIRVFVDGYYWGTVEPWGDLYGYVGRGNTSLYADANFNDGSRLTWGPSGIYLGYS